jgi:hypothetical protein
VALWASACGKQVLVPVHGFRLVPGALARVWTVLQAAHPGKFRITGHIVRYLQNGISYQELIPTGYQGSVSRTAPFIAVYA